eukprot:CAMPEP_0113623780 /NCGR_PEP_ID=MMETSP0017_2-20120614/12243_1 /TAXON_ID=2856 /ORGANISM="Cylindrotheca closterium" /LENGTH=519 /DNA_ID=CAMNT_0000533759 /DNA_START=36 /DNA_END=1592 /DNA_ORIENTATION=- /assembly_acc=CAM_ASM_000147
MIVSDSAFVLYVDHQGHPAPLAMSYHATASRRLASSLDRHPPSTVTEVDSAFCPQCLAFYDSNSASNMGYCPEAKCRLCPNCSAVANIVVEDGTAFYSCGSCAWNSKACELAVPVTVDSNGVISKEEVVKATQTLGKQYSTKAGDANKPSDTSFKGMLNALEGMAKEKVKGQRSTFIYSKGTSAAERRGIDGPEGWSVETLEESMETRRKDFSASADSRVGGQDPQIIPLDQPIVFDDSLKNEPVQALLMQQVGTGATSFAELLPLQVPLRPRKSRRCRAELAEGRPGILLKPKLNPLEGDSSLRTGHGQWWKKDSSAIQVLPRVRASKHASDGTKHAFLIKVSNPTLGNIRFRLASSDYGGEPVWDGDSTERNPLLENICVEPLNQKIVSASLAPEIGKSIQASTVVELEPGEDSFLDLGRSIYDEPEEVYRWKAEEALEDSKVSAENPSSVRVIDSRKSSAWLELIVMETPVDAGFSPAVALSLQIEVGGGSWESSLIQPESGDKKDMVNFDLVLVW